MDKSKLLELLRALEQGEISARQVCNELEDLPFKNLDFARIDTHRALRQGLPEVIFCPGKTAEQITDIASVLREKHNAVVGTKASPQIAALVKNQMPEVKYYALGKILLWGDMPEAEEDFVVSVVTAGTADIPIAEEAALYLQAAGVTVSRLNDVGIAGVHRILAALPELKESSVCIVVAGMDGALPGVVAGLVAKPVIAVPTSIGYGASFGGLAAMLTMLNSCAAGLTIVNIDNGFGAAMAALRIKQYQYPHAY